MNDYDNCHTWKVRKGSTVLAQVLTFIPGIKSQKAVHQALNGAIYVQQIGGGVFEGSLTMFVESQSELLAIDKINADGEYITVIYRGNSYRGVIDEEKIEWEAQKPGQYYTAEVTFHISDIIKGVVI